MTHQNNFSENDIFYKCPIDDSFHKNLEKMDMLREIVELKRPLEGDLWLTIREKLLIEWTYNTNALEGSTLTQGETMFFLKHGLTVEGKPFKDFVDAKNHAEAIEFLYESIKVREISPALLKQFNTLLLTGIRSTTAIDHFGNKVEKKATPGEYKLLPNHVLQSDGKIHKYVEPQQVAPQMEYLCTWIKENLEVSHPAVVSAVAHYNFVRIHPFDDGNGRGARLLMNLILIKKGFPPAIIKNEKRRYYTEALASADKGDLQTFVSFILNSCVETLEMIKGELERD